MRSCRKTSQYSFIPTSAIKHFPPCVFRITQPADLSCYIVLLSPGAIKHLCLFSSSQALLFLSKECPCAHPSNLGPIMEEVSLKQREGVGVSFKDRYKMEWGNKRLRVANDGKKAGDAGSQVLFII